MSRVDEPQNKHRVLNREPGVTLGRNLIMFLNALATVILAGRHATATALGRAGEAFTSAGNFLGTVSRRLDGNF